MAGGGVATELLARPLKIAPQRSMITRVPIAVRSARLRGVQAPERTPEQEEDFQALLAQVKELQPLPAVAVRLIAMSEDSRFSAQDLADTVRVDQALTLNVLRLSNSSFFGLPRRITSIREAIVLLGFREVRSLALSACVLDPLVRDALDHAGIDYDVFWLNSMVVGHLAQALAIVENVDQDQGFTAGLVHNIGRLALAQHRPEQLKTATLEARASRTTIHQAQARLLGYSDAELGAAVANAWAFPVPLIESIENHMRPLSDIPDRRSLDSIVIRARRFARSHGVSDGLELITTRPVPDIEWRSPDAERALRKLGGVDGILQRARGYLDARTDDEDAA